MHKIGPFFEAIKPGWIFILAIHAYSCLAWPCTWDESKAVASTNRCVSENGLSVLQIYGHFNVDNGFNQQMEWVAYFQRTPLMLSKVSAGLLGSSQFRNGWHTPSACMGDVKLP